MISVAVLAYLCKVTKRGFGVSSDIAHSFVGEIVAGLWNEERVAYLVGV
jgi:hypothetical protein